MFPLSEKNTKINQGISKNPLGMLVYLRQKIAISFLPIRNIIVQITTYFNFYQLINATGV